MSQLEPDLIITLGLLAAALALFLSDKLRPDFIALLVVFGLGVTGVLTPQEAFSGFSRSAVITVMAVFVLADALRRAGVADQMGSLLVRTAGSGERRLVALVMSASAGLSLLMNNIAAASVLLPAVSAASHRARVNPSRLMMPLAYATILGGMATLLTSANIVVSGVLRDNGYDGFGLLDFAPLGIPIVLAGIVYMAGWGRQHLPSQSVAERVQAAKGGVRSDLIGLYGLSAQLFRARVPAGSYLIGRTLAESTFRERYGLTVVAIQTSGKLDLDPPPSAVFHEGDVIVLQGDKQAFRKADVEPYLEILPPKSFTEPDLESSSVKVVEAVLAPRSGLIGQTLEQAHFRKKYGMTVLAVWRGEQPILAAPGRLPLAFGDALLLQGPRDRVAVLRDEKDLILLTEEDQTGTTATRPGKARIASAIVLVSVLLAALAPDLVGEVMLGGALAMILVGAMTMDEVYQAIDWRTVFVIAGMMPLGVAMSKTGAADLLASVLVNTVGTHGPLVLVAALVLLTTLLTQGINGVAVATIMAPIAIHVAEQVSAEPRSYAMAVALAASLAFITPLGHPVNLLVMGVGGYRTKDYAVVGIPLTILLLVVILVGLPVFWPVQP